MRREDAFIFVTLRLRRFSIGKAWAPSPLFHLIWVEVAEPQSLCSLLHNLINSCKSTLNHLSSETLKTLLFFFLLKWENFIALLTPFKFNGKHSQKGTFCHFQRDFGLMTHFARIYIVSLSRYPHMKAMLTSAEVTRQYVARCKCIRRFMCLPVFYQDGRIKFPLYFAFPQKDPAEPRHESTSLTSKIKRNQENILSKSGKGVGEERDAGGEETKTNAAVWWSREKKIKIKRDP